MVTTRGAITGSVANNGQFVIATVAAGTLTLNPDDQLTTGAAGPSVVVRWPGNGTWAESRFLTAGTRKVLVSGVEYTYTGGESGGTLTGLVGANAITAGDICLQAVTVSTPSALAGVVADRISMIYNYVFVGSTRSRVVSISRATDYSLFTFTSPLRKTGEGFTLTLDNATTGFAPSEDEMYITAGEDDWYKVAFILSSTVAGNEDVRITKLKTAAGQAAVSQGAIVHIKNAIAYLSFEPTIDTLGRVENISGGPTTLPISDDIKNDLEAYDLTDAHGLYHRRVLYIALPAEGVLLMYDLQNLYWQPPQLLPIGRLALIDIENNGKVVLCGHSSFSNETYRLFTGYNDNGASFQIVMAFGYENYGARFTPKTFDEAATELFISSNTKVKNQILYDYKGASDIREFEIDGADETIRFEPQAIAGGLGQAPLGTQPYGSLLEPPDDMPKVRAVDTTPVLDFFERQRVFSSDSPDARFAVLAYGENVEISDNIPAYLKR